MIKKNGNRFKKTRVIFQIFFLILFFFLLIRAGKSTVEASKTLGLFFYFDPLILIANFIATGKILAIFLLSLIPVILTVIFGRFFCGWVCPFGAVNHFFSYLFNKNKKWKKTAPKKKLLKLKYLILILILFSALFNTHLVGWLDPFSLFTRTSAVVIEPSINYSIEHVFKSGAKGQGIISTVTKHPYKFVKKNIVKNEPRHSSQAAILGIIFFGIILLNLLYHRFFCNYLCPLGALYGLIAKFSFINLKINKTCKECSLCSKNCSYYGSPYDDYNKSECILCYNCVGDCSHDSIEICYRAPKKGNRTNIDLSRREFAGALTSGVFFGTIGKLSLSNKMKTRSYTRPPGSLGEKEFLKKCIRCGECIQVCPTNFIQPALFQSGVEGLWTPVLNSRVGSCDFECKKCLQVCPTNAIEDLPLKDKKLFKIGTAVIDKDRCYTYADGYNCAVCEEHCPLPEKAIKYRDVKVWNFEGKLMNVKQIYVDPDLCIGCGICENVCPRSDAPGIVLTSEEEQREAY